MARTGGSNVRPNPLRIALVVLLMMPILAFGEETAAALGELLPGEHDASFGTAGVAEIRYRPTSDAEAHAVMVLTSSPERVVLIGTADGDFALHQPSQPAGGFGAIAWLGGRLIADFDGRNDIAYSGARYTNDLVVAAGSSDSDVALVRWEVYRGGPDLTFGNRGKVLLDFGGNDVAYSVISTPNRLVVGGSLGGPFSLAGIGHDGGLDPTFGTDGLATAGLPGTVRTVLELPDGKLIAAGDNGTDLLFARFSASGELDKSYGNAGITTIDSGATDTTAGAALDAAGSLVVAGTAESDYLVARLTPDGGMDAGFGISGLVRSDFGSSEAAKALVVRPDGHLLVGGQREGATLFASYGSTGALETTFGGTNMVHGRPGVASVNAMTSVPGKDSWYAAGSSGITDFNFVFGSSPYNTGPLTHMGYIPFGQPRQEVLAIEPMSDGSSVALGKAGDSTVLFKLTPSGRIDLSFGRNGFAVTDEMTPRSALVVQADGSIVVGGGRHDRSSLRRFTAKGVLDTSFGVDIEFNHPVGDNSPSAKPFMALEVQPSGRLLALGVDEETIRAFTPDGKVDGSFGDEGKVTFSDSKLYTMILDKAGKIYVGGLVGDHGGSRRLSADGDIESTYESHHILAVQEDGKLLAGVGMSPVGSERLRRHHTDGSFDLSFGSQGRTGFLKIQEVPHSRFYSMHLQTDGAIVAVDSHGVGRKLPDGSDDANFDELGYKALSEFSRGDIKSSAIQNGRLYLGGGSSERFVVMRLGLDDNPPDLASAWGWNALGQLGDGSIQDAIQRQRMAGVTGGGDVSAGLWHSLISEPDGTVFAAGWNGMAQLGNGTHLDSIHPVRVPGLSNVVQVAAGWYHSLALKSDGTVWAWGWNGLGALGLNPASVSESSRPVRVPGLSNVTSVSAGSFHSLASRSDGSVVAWGWNGLGQLGLGTRATIATPVKIPGLNGVSKVSGGYIHSLAMKTDGTVWAWGSNILGQLGDGTITDRLAPVRVATDVKDVSAGLLHSAAVSRAGRVLTWGWNGSGQLGNGNNVFDRRTPEPTIGTSLANAERVSAGGLHTVAMDAEGRIWTWGDRSLGQLGRGAPADALPRCCVYAPDRIRGVTHQVKVSAGYLHTLST
jgi:uncharacterized delta-60 repeat protein